MKIAVLIKQTPDTAELPKIAAEEVSSGQISATTVINPWDEFAVEEAIQLADRFDANTVAIAMGSDGTQDALKHALAMGVESAIIVDYDPMRIDNWGTSRVLASAIEQQGGVDIVLAGKQSVDGNSGSVFVGVARKLGHPLLVNVSRIVDVENGLLTAERLLAGSTETIAVQLPIVISVAKEINEPRYPSFMGIRKANRAEIPVLTLDELGCEPGEITSEWTNVRKPEVRKTEVQMITGDTVAEKAANLAEALIAEKLL